MPIFSKYIFTIVIFSVFETFLLNHMHRYFNFVVIGLGRAASLSIMWRMTVCKRREKGKKKRNHVSHVIQWSVEDQTCVLKHRFLSAKMTFWPKKMVEKLGNTDGHGSTELHDIYLILYKKTKIRLSCSGQWTNKRII